MRRRGVRPRRRAAALTRGRSSRVSTVTPQRRRWPIRCAHGTRLGRHQLSCGRAFLVCQWRARTRALAPTLRLTTPLPLSVFRPPRAPVCVIDYRQEEGAPPPGSGAATAAQASGGGALWYDFQGAIIHSGVAGGGHYVSIVSRLLAPTVLCSSSHPATVLIMIDPIVSHPYHAVLSRASAMWDGGFTWLVDRSWAAGRCGCRSSNRTGGLCSLMTTRPFRSTRPRFRTTALVGQALVAALCLRARRMRWLRWRACNNNAAARTQAVRPMMAGRRAASLGASGPRTPTCSSTRSRRASPRGSRRCQGVSAFPLRYFVTRTHSI
jgi:hypothetical protein